MPKSSHNVIAIGTAKRVLEPESREYVRMRSYAERFEQFHVVVLTRASDELPARIDDGNLHIYGTNTRSKVGMIFAAISIVRNILREAGDWTITTQDPFEISFVAWVATLGKQVRRQAQIHGDVFNPKFDSGLVHKLRIRFARWYLKRIDSVRVVSKRIQRSVIALGVSEERIKVLPIQADIRSFLDIGNQRSYAESNNLNFLYVGRFSPEKNLEMLIKAFANHQSRHHTSRLLLVGDGAEYEKLRTLVDRMHLEEQIAFQHWTNDVSSVMRQADVFCLSSLHEGWAMVAVEAAAAGLPVIMTDVGCAGEFVKNDQQGRVVPVDNRAAFAEAMDAYASQPDTLSTHGSNGHLSAGQWAMDESTYYDAWVEALTS